MNSRLELSGSIELISASQGEIVDGFGIPKEAAQEVGRVAARFALVAFAGEAVTGFSITGWQPGEALKAARRCFRDWLADNGGGIASDESRLIEHFVSYMQKHHANKFPPHDAEPEELAKFHQIVGYRFDDGNDIEFWALPGPTREEITKGFPLRWAMKTLIDRGLVKAGDIDGGKQRTTSKKRIRAMGSKPTNVHIILQAALVGGE